MLCVALTCAYGDYMTTVHKEELLSVCKLDCKHFQLVFEEFTYFPNSLVKCD